MPIPKSAVLPASCYWDEHELVHTQPDICLTQPDWEWADLDGSRLVWATAGRLWTGVLNDSDLVKPRQLFDVTPMTFERHRAPY